MKKKPTIAIPPEGKYLQFIAGKEYKIKKWITDCLFVIISDYGLESYCKVRDCAHLNYKDWILK